MGPVAYGAHYACGGGRRQDCGLWGYRPLGLPGPAVCPQGLPAAGRGHRPLRRYGGGCERGADRHPRLHYGEAVFREAGLSGGLGAAGAPPRDGPDQLPDGEMDRLRHTKRLLKSRKRRCLPAGNGV